MTNTLIALVVVAIVLWLVFWLLEKVTLGEPANMVIKVVAVVLAIWYLVTHFL